MKVHRKSLIKEAGVTTIELLTGVAIGGAVAFGTASLIKNVLQGQKEADARTNTMVIEKMFEQHMYSRKGCEDISGLKIGDSFDVNVANMTLKEGVEVSPSDMRFKQTKVDSLKIVGFEPSDATNTRGITRLTLNMTSNGRKVSKVVPVAVNVSTVGSDLKIDGCLMSDKSVESAILGTICPDTYGSTTTGLNCVDASTAVRTYIIQKICTDLDQGTLTSMGIDECIMNHLHASQSCAVGDLATGFDWAGNLVCTATPVNPLPPPTCGSWTAWTPNVNTVCKDKNFIQSRTCNDGVVTDTDTQGAVGTKTTAECADDLKCNISYQAWHESRTSPIQSNGTWAAWGWTGNDYECDSFPNCGMRMGIACTGPTKVRLKYQYRLGTQSPEITTLWSDPTGATIWGGNATTSNHIHDECDNNYYCGLRVVAETQDPAYKCTTQYQFHNEKLAPTGLTPLMSDGAWSSKKIDASDDNCEKNWGCGIRATISCVKL